MKNQTFFIFFALIIIQGHLGWAHFEENHQSGDYDILLLTQTWLPAICKTPQRYSLPYYCSVTHDYNRWNIHGLWPHKRNGQSPQNCDNIPLMDENISTIKTRLENNWVDVFAVNRKKIHEMRDFWEKEWKKHGTCAVNPADRTAQFDYFERTLLLFDKYNISKILKESNIVPGKAYPYNELFSAINKKVKKDFQIVCYVEGNTRRNGVISDIQYLKEIRICFEKYSSKPINCGSSDTQHCLRSKKIIYLNARPAQNRAGASTGPNQMNPPTGNAPRNNPSGFGPREYSFGIGSQKPAVRSGPQVPSRSFGN